MLTARAYLAIAAVVALLAIVGGWYAYTRHLQHEAQKARVEAAVAHAGEVVAKGQSAAASDAAKITDAGASRDAQTQTTHEGNADAIRHAPGASVPVDPAAAATALRGLCHYKSAASDPRCAALRAAHQ